MIMVMSLNELFLGCSSLSKDSSWLLHVKDDFQDTYGVLGSWSDSTNVCEWTGITCSKDGLRVVGLNLSSSSLSGSISPALANLQALRILDLSANSLSGSIPPELGNLSSLTELLLFF